MDGGSLSPLPQLPSLSELESRMQLMRVEENQTGETFYQLAEWFYQRRPLLLSLCQDLYDGYATLLDRFFQQSQVVNANLEKDIAQHESRRRETKLQEASKTIELLKKLVMLLDMEKEVVVEETANLAQKVTTLLEDNRELATEALFMKKEAVRVARCMLKMRDDHFHKVSLLQNQIYVLESSREPDYEKVSSVSCFGLDNININSKKKRKMSERRSEAGETKRSKWLNKLNPFYSP